MELVGRATGQSGDHAVPIGSESAGAAFKDPWTLGDVDEARHGEIADRVPSTLGWIAAHGCHAFRGSFLSLPAPKRP